MNGLAQIHAPTSLAAYGGATLLIESMAIPNAVNKTRVFVATLSANSVFYADVDHSLANPFGTNLFFRTAPGLDSAGNHGTPSSIAAHAPSGRLFVGDENEGLFSCTTNADSFITNYVGYVGDVLIRDSHLFFTQWDSTNRIFNLRYGIVSTTGTFTENVASPCPLAADQDSLAMVTLAVHPTNNLLYVAFHRTNLFLKSSTTYDAFSAAVTFTPFEVSSTVSNWLDTETGFRPLAFGPDGRMFFSAYVSSSSMEYVVYSDDDGAMWSTPVATCGGQVTKAVGSADSYTVYSGRGISANKGVTWAEFGSTIPGARVMTGSALPVASDPYFPQIIYCITEGGVGVTTNSGVSELFDISRGIEALQITDFDVTPSREVAWIAARGVYRATNFNVAAHWTESMWPGGDPVCRAIGLDKSDTSGNTVFVGGSDLYKTTDAGGSNGTNWVRVFSITNYGVTNGIVSSVKADGNTVVAGCYGAYDSKGGFFKSTNGGSTWTAVTLHTDGVDVNDILLTEENGIKVAYVAVARDDSVTAGSGLYRITGDTVSREVSDLVSIRDLAVDSSGHIYASGLDANTNVVVYYKEGDSHAWIWRTLALTNYPAYNSWWSSLWCGGIGPVITVGLDSASNEVPYMTANEYVPELSAFRYGIYYLSSTSSTWQTSSALSYPVGSQIYVLYWDDLVVGTSIGLYGQAIQITTNPPVPPTAVNTLISADYDGDGKADPAVYVESNGVWYVKLSASGYELVTLSFGGTGYSARVADFDGDGKADPALYQESTGDWYVKLSASGYGLATLTGFGGEGYTARAADYDGDGKADPALYKNATGNWQVKLSASGYAIATLTGFGGEGAAMKLADFDGDGKTDPAVYQGATGNWYVKLSGSGYATASLSGFGGAGYDAGVSDFDGDGKADPTIYEEATGNWTVKLSASGYATASLLGFGGAGYSEDASDFDGDRKADPILFDTATGMWHVKLSASGYAEATLASGYTP